MLSKKEYQRRNSWSPEKNGIYPPCQCCDAWICPSIQERHLPTWWREEKFSRFAEAAKVRWGDAPVGFACIRLNRWLLGLTYARFAP